MLKKGIHIMADFINIFKGGNRKHIYLAILIIVLYLTPFFILGQESPILIHDNLDSNVVFFKTLAESGQIFGSIDTIIPNIMNGVNRSSFGSEFNIILWLYVLFKPFTAYVINITLMHFVAFVGMYALLKNHLLRDEKHELIIVGVSLAFALLPFWPSGGLSIAGQPLALYAFLNIRANQYTTKDWILILLLPFYSSFVTSFVFFLFALGILWIYDNFNTKKINYIFIMAIILMSIVFLIVEYRLVFDMFLNSTFQSHRVEFIGQGVNIIEAIKQSAYNFIFGQYHAASLQQYFIGLSVVFAVITVYRKKLQEYLLFIMLTITLMISLLYGFWNWEGLHLVKESITILNSFNFTRFHWLHPLLWYIIFATSLRIVFDNAKYGKKLVVFLIILQVAFLFSYANPAVQSGGLGIIQSNGLTYEEFYSEDLFEDITTYIGKPTNDYRIVSIGLYPSIAQYNGFYTLDSYQANYALGYKHEFRKIIENELDKNDALRLYFDNWGSRCYIFVDELGTDYLYTKNKDVKVNNLELNSEELKNLGGEYVLSAVEIINYDDNNLTLLNTFNNDRSPWRIWLYQIE